MARVLFVARQMCPVLDQAVTELTAASHAVTCTTFDQTSGIPATVVVAVVANDKDLSAMKQLARGSAPVIAIVDVGDRTDVVAGGRAAARAAVRCMRAGAVWSVPTFAYLGTSLTEGSYSVDQAIAMKRIFEENGELKYEYCRTFYPSGIKRFLKERGAEGLMPLYSSALGSTH